MENIYTPELSSCTKPIDFQQYFQEFENVVHTSTQSSKSNLHGIKDLLFQEFGLDLNLKQVKDLDSICTVEKLKVSNENPKLPLVLKKNTTDIKEAHPITKEAQSLNTIKSLLQFKALKQDGLVGFKRFVYNLNQPKDDIDYVNIQPGKAYLLEVVVFKPFQAFSDVRVTADSLRPQYTFTMLNSSTLLELADLISCISDKFSFKEVQTMDVDLSQFENMKEKYPSRCIFVENTFYNDYSNPDNVDYSEVVRKWAVEKNIGNFESQSMDIPIQSLKFRLGYGYLYIHQGFCEHIISFTDARLVQRHDTLVSSNYPKATFIKRYRNNNCSICKVNFSSWMVVDSDRLPMRNSFLCTKCCKSYMFLDGKKIGKFQLYPYFQESVDKVSSDEEEADSDE